MVCRCVCSVLCPHVWHGVIVDVFTCTTPCPDKLPLTASQGTPLGLVVHAKCLSLWLLVLHFSHETWLLCLCRALWSSLADCLLD